jgi:hypothetical protein
VLTSSAVQRRHPSDRRLAGRHTTSARTSPTATGATAHIGSDLAGDPGRVAGAHCRRGVEDAGSSGGARPVGAHAPTGSAHLTQSSRRGTQAPSLAGFSARTANRAGVPSTGSSEETDSSRVHSTSTSRSSPGACHPARAPRRRGSSPSRAARNLFQKVDRRQAMDVVNVPSLAHVPGSSASSPIRATSLGGVSTSLRAQRGHR